MLGRGSALWSTLVLRSVFVGHFHASGRALSSASAVSAKVAIVEWRRVNHLPAPTSSLPPLHVQGGARNMKQKTVRVRRTTRDACQRSLDGPAGLLRLMSKELSNHLHLTSSADKWASWKHFLGDGEAVCRLAEQLALTATPFRVIQLLLVGHSLGFRYKQSVYERAVYRLANAGQWRLVVLVADEAETITGRATARLLNWKMRGFVHLQNYALLHDTLDKFSTYGLQPHRRTFQLMLRGYLLNHDYARATETIRLMEQAGFSADSDTFLQLASAVRGLGWEHTVKEEAESVLDGRELEQEGNVLNVLLQLYLNRHDLEGALGLLASVERQEQILNSVKPSTSCNAVQPSVIVHGRADGDCSQLQSSLRVDCETFALLINHLTKRRSWGTLKNVIKRMKLALTSYDANLASALVRMHLAQGRWNWSLHILREVCPQKSYNRRLFRRLGYKIDEHYRTWARFSGTPTTRFFNAIMQGVVEKRGLQCVPAVLTLMKYYDVNPNGATLEVILNFMQKKRTLRPEAIARALKMLLSFPLDPSQRHLNIILKAIVARRKRWFRPYYNILWRDRFSRFRRRGVALPVAEGKFKNDSIPPLSGPDLGIAQHDLDGSPYLASLLSPILHDLNARAVKPNRETYAIRMKYDLYSFSPKEALDSIKAAFEHMRERGMRPDLRHYAALVGAHSELLNFDAIEKVFDEAEVEGALSFPFSRAILYTVTITALGRKGNLAGVLRVFEDMLRKGVKPDPGVLAAVVSAFRMNRKNKRARRILIDLWPSVAPFPMHYRHAGLDRLLFLLRKCEPDGRLGRLDRRNKKDLPLWTTLKTVSEEWKEMTSRKSGIRVIQHATMIGPGSSQKSA